MSEAQTEITDEIVCAMRVGRNTEVLVTHGEGDAPLVMAADFPLVATVDAHPRDKVVAAPFGRS